MAPLAHALAYFPGRACVPPRRNCPNYGRVLEGRFDRRAARCSANIGTPALRRATALGWAA
eukprot:3098262-Alexandrium_andersonii.AAC.1